MSDRASGIGPEVPERKQRAERASLSGGGRGIGPDLDALARAEEERDFLLRSIEDLDREHAAGDVDDVDYAELRDGYVVRAADAIRSVEAGESKLAAQRDARSPRRGRALVWAGVVVVFTVVAGVLLAGALGSRTSDETVTGAGAMPDSDSTRCRSLSLSKPEEGIACYDDLLAETPDDVDALTYQGWAKVRSGDVAGGSAAFDRVVEIDPTFPDVHVFRASVAKNAGDFAAAQRELDTLYSLNPSPVVLSTLTQMGLDRDVALGLLPADVSECWKVEEPALNATIEALGDGSDIDREAAVAGMADVATAMGCLDRVVTERPVDADALTLRSVGAGVIGFLEPKSVERAEADAAAALAARPDDPTALALRAVWLNALGRFDEALSMVDALGERRISPLVATYLDTSNLRAGITAQQREAQASATSTTAP